MSSDRRAFAPDDVVNVAAVTIISAFAGTNIEKIENSLGGALIVGFGILGLAMQAASMHAAQNLTQPTTLKVLGTIMLVGSLSTMNGLALSGMTDLNFIAFGLAYGWVFAFIFLRFVKYTSSSRGDANE